VIFRLADWSFSGTAELATAVMLAALVVAALLA
jgi:hypothetical protein